MISVLTVSPFPSVPKDQLYSMLIRAIVVEDFGMAPYWFSSRTLMTVGFTKPPSGAVVRSFGVVTSGIQVTLLFKRAFVNV